MTVDARTNLIPAAASKFEPRREVGGGSEMFMHAKFVLWAMQQEDIDSITVRRVQGVLQVSKQTAQRLRTLWRDITARRFYRESVPDIVSVQSRIHGLGEARNDMG
ncbi:MAG TPA: hypothetical protein VJ823_00170 [Rhodanobacteraceae bacterium]|nr:hypothetical protein [Rhodanobacteraceae bacterium]